LQNLSLANLPLFEDLRESLVGPVGPIL
jgi:hypothetical protein